MKKNVTRRFFSILIAIVLLVSLVSCGGDTDKGSDTQKDAVTTAASASGSTQEGKDRPLYKVAVFGGTMNDGTIRTSDETDVGKVIKDKFNVVFETIPFSGNFGDKLNLMLVAGDYPEMLGLQGEDIFQKYLQAGSLLSLDEYLDNMPNFKRLFDVQIPYWRLSADDGKLYKWEGGVPNAKEVNTDVFGVQVRSDVLEKQGYPKVLSATQYIDFIRQGLKDFPETNGKKTLGMVVPFGESWGLIGIGTVMFEKGETYPISTDRTAVYNMKTDKFEPLLETQEVKDGFHFWNRLYREGLLDTECFTDKSDQIVTKCKEARAICSWYAGWLSSEANSDFIKTGQTKYRYVKLPIQSDAQVANKERFNLMLETTRPFGSKVITKNAKDPARLIEVLEWSCSDEGQRTLKSGVEGKHYTMENGKPKIAPELAQNYTDRAYMVKSGIDGIFSEYMASTNGVDVNGYPFDVRIGLDQDPRDKEVYNALGFANKLELLLSNGVGWESGMTGSISISGNSDLNKLNAMVQDYMTKYLPKVIIEPTTDEEFDQQWDALLEGYKKYDPQKLVDEDNRLYSEKKAKLEAMMNK